MLTATADLRADKTNSAARANNGVQTSLIRVMIAGLLASSSASAVQAANCGAAALGGGSVGPPSISATEASTTQVLEEIRRRTQVAQQQMQPTPVSDTTVVPATSGNGSAASGGTAKPAPQAAQSAPGAGNKPKYTTVAANEPGDLSEYSYDGGTHKVTSSWGQAYLDYEFHDNIAPGQQENRARNSRTAGALSGTDWTWVKASSVPQAVQFGLFSGYQNQSNTFSNTNFSAPQTSDADPDTFSRTNNNQDIEGSFYGAYLASIQGNATFDLAFKADVFDLHQSSTLTQTNAAPGCSGQPFIAAEIGDASVNNYTISADASYRHHLSQSSWIEPTIGLRYTWTSYGNDPTQLVNISPSGILQQSVSGGRLGLEDGTVFRMTVGARLGHEEILPGGTLWTIWGGLYAYSDLAISGFKFTPPTIVDGGGNTVSAGATVFPVDEGKVRGLGQIVSTWDYSDHWSYLLAGEVRGGEDLFGVGGRVGARYRW